MTQEQKPKYPYVEFLATRNKGKPDEVKEPFFFNLESAAGTFDNVLRYSMKGWPIIGYGNLLPATAGGGVTTADSMGDEHQKIRSHIDNNKTMVNMAMADYEKQRTETPASTFEQKV